jgi:flagellar basal body-associated protein FliL
MERKKERKRKRRRRRIIIIIIIIIIIRRNGAKTISFQTLFGKLNKTFKKNQRMNDETNNLFVLVNDIDMIFLMV